MEEDEEEHQIWLLSKERQQNLRGIITVMGLPATFKTFLADLIGEWAKCPVLCIQHFLDGCDKKAVAEVVKESDTPEKDEHRRQLLVQRAFPRLLKVAKFQKSRGYGSRPHNSTVVIKSRLKSIFELDKLIEIVNSTNIESDEKYPLLIIECRITNEFRWKNHFENMKISGAGDIEDEVMRSWYMPASWNEMEDLIAKDHDFQAKWDQQLLLKGSHYAPIVRRLVMDPTSDDAFNFVDYCLCTFFADAIKYLLTTPQEELIHNFRNPYTVRYRELRPYLLEKRLSAAESKGRRNYLCSGGDCVFKYSEARNLCRDDDNEAVSNSSNLAYCGVCEQQVVAETPTYTCRLCTLTLHKSCAERIDFKALLFSIEDLWKYYRRNHLQHEYACKSCLEAGKYFNDECGSCLYQTHLKCVPIPININHDSHPHLLSLYLTRSGYNCRACGKFSYDISYRCLQCASFYHLRCAFLPLELRKHNHGGHEHLMKLMDSLHEDGMEQEETYWCEVCYKDIDPEACCYLCQDCPNYVTDVECAGGFKFLHKPKDVKLVQQLQPQLEGAFPEIFGASRIVTIVDSSDNKSKIDLT